MAENAQRRARFFDLHTRNLAFYDGKLGHVFVCPLCRIILPREALTTSPPLLTLAHIIPASLGGTTCTLACASCNNGNGTGLERALLEQFRQDDWLNGVGTQSGRLTTDAGSVTIEMQRTPDGGWKFDVDLSRSNPANVDAIRKQMEGLAQNPEGFTFSFGWKAWNAPPRVKAALLQSAYLLLFSHFGYEVLCHPHFEDVRQRLLRRDGEVWRPPVMVLTEEITNNLTRGQHALVFLREPRVIVAAFRFVPAGGKPRLLGVTLPGLDSPDISDVTPRTCDAAYVQYVPEALTHGAGYMRFLWNTYHGIGEAHT